MKNELQLEAVIFRALMKAKEGLPFGDLAHVMLVVQTINGYDQQTWGFKSVSVSDDADARSAPHS